MKSFSRRLNMSWYILSKISQNSTCKRRSECTTLSSSRQVKFVYWEFRSTTSWNEKRIYKTHKKNDDAVVDFFTIDCVHLRSVFCKDQVDLHDNHSINYHLRFYYLIRVARTFE
jgi:hypothetical protein